MIETQRPDSATSKGESETTLSPFLTLSRSHFVLAGAATLCGTLSVGALTRQGSLQPAMMALVLACAWQVLWAIVLRTNWQPARAAWRAWSLGKPLGRLPYTQAGSDADHISKDLGQFSAWLRDWLLPRHGSALLVAIAAGVVAVVLAMAINLPAMLLTITFLVVIQTALVLCAGNGKPAVWAEGIAVIGLPVALGVVALGPASLPVTLACLVMGIALMALQAGQLKLLHAGSVLTIMAFVLLREPAAAFAVSVVWASAMLLRPAGNRLGLVLLCLAGVAIALVL